ncbi:cystine/glutamate transporter isoform X2 [Microcaecilia unicolor]|uniref:Cystine/glutamate transporter-like isoform X2 n=1 Tax=Microcaecilia unicolor TaxID=1415580 RepID=A0A6P7YTY1_9AMPH|nr:cystine/glutamate transporter-like isoform X2 [Microcaecilia unicolor]
MAPNLENKGDSVFLRRKITLLRCISMIIGTIVGSGIFISPKGVLENTGSIGLSLIIWLACGILSMLGIVTALNSWSVSWSAKLQTFLSAIKLTALALVIVPGIMLLNQGHIENFQGAFDGTMALDKLSLAFYPGMFAYSGWFQINYLREEVVNPERNIPVAVIVSMLTVIFGYLLTNISYYTVLTPESVLASEAVAVSFADQAFKGLVTVIPVLVSLSCLGTLNAGSYGLSRTLFVASRERQWPLIFSMINIHRNTPLPAVILLFPMIAILVSIGEIYFLLKFFGFSRWLFIGLASLGLIIHRYRHPKLPRPFKVPLFVPILFTTICFFTVMISIYSAPDSVGFGCLIILTGLPVYFLMVKRAKSTSCSSLSNYITLKLQILLQVIPQEICTY